MGKNTIQHWEIMGADGPALSNFYGKVFDWAPQAWPGIGEYFGVDTEHSGLGGAVGKGSEEMPSYVMIYVGVDNIDEHLKMIEAAGGSTVLGRTVIPGVVTYGQFRDPAGNVVGLTELVTPPA